MDKKCLTRSKKYTWIPKLAFFIIIIFIFVALSPKYIDYDGWDNVAVIIVSYWVFLICGLIILAYGLYSIVLYRKCKLIVGKK